jgi:hypothetical protein
MDSIRILVEPLDQPFAIISKIQSSKLVLVLILKTPEHL